MNLHFLGICGTFMGSLARLAKQQGNRVSGADQNVYPPMSDQLEAEGIELTDGYDPDGIPADTDLIIVGNALSRGNPSVEYLLDNNLAYASGPQWLAEHVLSNRRVIAVAGTHGKTTTSSLLAWILEHAGLNPSFLIGGVPGNFGVSSRLTDSEWFVIEADEYDTAFFDKRSKFVHYRPFIQVLNNLEFDHADIFNSIDDIKTQFHHLVRVVPQSGHIIHNADDQHLKDVLNRGCWSARQGFSATSDAHWHGHIDAAHGNSIKITTPAPDTHVSDWPLQGQHNLMNCIAATAAAHCAGISPQKSLEAIRQFRGIKRRMECLHDSDTLTVFEDFAHHPTAIRLTLEGCRQHWPEHELVVALEPRSNTMRMGTLAGELPSALEAADRILVLSKPELDWNAQITLSSLGKRLSVHDSVDDMLPLLSQMPSHPTIVLLMSNGSFDGLPARLSAILKPETGTEKS